MCLAAVGVVADLCRELKEAIFPYCDEIMMLLLENLSVSEIIQMIEIGFRTVSAIFIVGIARFRIIRCVVR